MNKDRLGNSIMATGFFGNVLDKLVEVTKEFDAKSSILATDEVNSTMKEIADAVFLVQKGGIDFSTKVPSIFSSQPSQWGSFCNAYFQAVLTAITRYYQYHSESKRDSQVIKDLIEQSIKLLRLINENRPCKDFPSFSKLDAVRLNDVFKLSSDASETPSSSRFSL